MIWSLLAWHANEIMKEVWLWLITCPVQHLAEHVLRDGRELLRLVPAGQVLGLRFGHDQLGCLASLLIIGLLLLVELLALAAVRSCRLKRENSCLS